MKEKLKEVQQYFKNKLINGEFEVDEITEHVLYVKIEGLSFSIWIGNFDIISSIRLYDNFPNVVWFNLNLKECQKLKTKLKPIVEKYRSSNLIDIKKKELKKLENEIKNLSK